MTQRLRTRAAIGSLALATIVAGTLGSYGCGDDEPNTPNNPDAATNGVDAGPVGGTHTHYVTSSLVVGPTAQDAADRAFDVDGNGSKENKLGSVLVTLSILGLNIDTTLSTALSAGDVILLHSLKASSFTTAASATWQIFIGDPEPEPDLTSGNGTFTVAADSPANAILSGSIAAGTFTGGPGTISLSLALVDGAAPISIPIHNARIEADVTATGCTNGRLGGGVTATDLNTVILPALVAAFNARINADGTCRTAFNTCNDPNKALLSALDRNADSGNSNGQIEVAEITGNATIGTFLVPDVDILNASGGAGTDGTKDSLSIAVGFDCTRAVFTASSEQ